MNEVFNSKTHKLPGMAPPRTELINSSRLLQRRSSFNPDVLRKSKLRRNSFFGTEILNSFLLFGRWISGRIQLIPKIISTIYFIKMKVLLRRYSESQIEGGKEALKTRENANRRKTIGIVLRRGIKKFRKAVRIVIVLLRSGG